MWKIRIEWMDKDVETFDSIKDHYVKDGLLVLKISDDNIINIPINNIKIISKKEY